MGFVFSLQSSSDEKQLSFSLEPWNTNSWTHFTSLRIRWSSKGESKYRNHTHFVVTLFTQLTILTQDESEANTRAFYSHLSLSTLSINRFIMWARDSLFWKGGRGNRDKKSLSWNNVFNENLFKCGSIWYIKYFMMQLE